MTIAFVLLCESSSPSAVACNEPILTVTCDGRQSRPPDHRAGADPCAGDDRAADAGRWWDRRDTARTGDPGLTDAGEPDGVDHEHDANGDAGDRHAVSTHTVLRLVVCRSSLTDGCDCSGMTVMLAMVRGWGIESDAMSYRPVWAFCAGLGTLVQLVGWSKLTS